MKKILLYRTVRPEEIGFVVKDINMNFGSDLDITIITRPENIASMEAIPAVKDVLCFSGNIFHISNDLKSEITNLKKHKFDIAIIPTSGNINSYDNVISFSKKVFGHIPTYYYKYPRKFIRYRSNIFGTSLKGVIKLLSAFLTIPLIIVFFIGVGFSRSIRK